MPIGMDLFHRILSIHSNRHIPDVVFPINGIYEYENDKKNHEGDSWYEVFQQCVMGRQNGYWFQSLSRRKRGSSIGL